MIYVEDVESIVKNIIGNNRGEFSRYNILNSLKNSCMYKQKGRSKALIFDENEVWSNYFMKDTTLKILIVKTEY